MRKTKNSSLEGKVGFVSVWNEVLGIAGEDLFPALRVKTRLLQLSLVLCLVQPLWQRHCDNGVQDTLELTSCLLDLGLVCEFLFPNSFQNFLSVSMRGCWPLPVASRPACSQAAPLSCGYVRGGCSDMGRNGWFHCWHGYDQDVCLCASCTKMHIARVHWCLWCCL